MIYEIVNSHELTISKCELSSRLKMPATDFPDDLNSYIMKISEMSEPSYSAVELDVRYISTETLDIGGVVCSSKALAKVLDGCSSAVLLCATLGFGSERHLRKASSGSPSGYFMLDAVADAMVEALCDLAEERVLSGRAHTARFSPGYADLPLEFVKEIVHMTDAEKLLGVRLTKSMLAVPAKTVTAIIGIKD